jgi:predicted XRE-type DNA-binding protein
MAANGGLQRTRRVRPVTAHDERVDPGSGNVFADLGLRDAEDFQMRGLLIFRIGGILRARKLTQAAAADLLDIDRADVSRLLKGEFVRRFTTARLLRLVNRLDHDVEIVITPKPRTVSPIWV